MSTLSVVPPAKNDGTCCVCEDDGGCIDYYDADRPGECLWCHRHPSERCPAVIRSSAVSR